MKTSKKDYVYIMYYSNVDGRGKIVFQALNRYIASEKLKEFYASQEHGSGDYVIIDGSELFGWSEKTVF